MQLLLIAAVEESLKHFLTVARDQGEVLLGGITLSSPSKLRISIVDKRYEPYKFTIEVQQS
jgi:hypothetical protein